MDRSKPLIPPKKYLQFAFHHWVEQIDSDGRGMGLVVMQWQPGAKSWCLPNQYASGVALPLNGYVWRGLCPTPPLRDELIEFNQALDKIKESKILDGVLNGVEKETFLRLIHEHIGGVVEERNGEL